MLVSFFFTNTATTEIYTLSLHDALPISRRRRARHRGAPRGARSRARKSNLRRGAHRQRKTVREDRKSTRLNSSHSQISYAVFCLKKKKNKKYNANEAPTKLQSVNDVSCG